MSIPTAAKDIPEAPILEFLRGQYPEWCHLFASEYPQSVFRAMPEGTPYKVGLAKMRALIKRGLVDGCGCGCRGDFVLTAAGLKAAGG